MATYRTADPDRPESLSLQLDVSIAGGAGNLRKRARAVFYLSVLHVHNGHWTDDIRSATTRP